MEFVAFTGAARVDIGHATLHPGDRVRHVMKEECTGRKNRQRWSESWDDLAGSNCVRDGAASVQCLPADVHSGEAGRCGSGRSSM